FHYATMWNVAKSPSQGSRGERLALRFHPEGYGKQSGDKGQRGKCHRQADAAVMRDARADQERRARRDESTDAGGKSESAAAAFSAVLFRQPRNIDAETRAAHANEEQAGNENMQGAVRQVERPSEAKPDRCRHQAEEAS